MKDAMEQKTLIIGDVRNIILGARTTLPRNCHGCPDVVQAIGLLKNENFDRVLLSIDAGGQRIRSALDSLRKISPQTEIELLTRIYQEPYARKLTTSPNGSAPPASDYHVTPIDRGLFEKNILQRTTAAPPAVPRQTTEDRLRERIRILERLATEDDLTKLRNRRYVFEFLRQLISRVQNEKMQVTLLLFDIDDFKSYNDQFGHSTGDLILKQAAEVLKRCSRKHDVVARIGGDEFALIFWDAGYERKISSPNASERRHEGAEHPRQAMQIAQRFRKEINSAQLPLLGPEGKGKLTISGGLATFKRDAENLEELFEAADSALLDAKNSGKNRIYIVGQPEENQQ